MEELPNHTARNIEHAQRMDESRVLGTRICQMGEPKLAYPPEPLKFLGCDHFDKPTVHRGEVDQVVDGIAEDLGFGGLG